MIIRKTILVAGLLIVLCSVALTGEVAAQTTVEEINGIILIGDDFGLSYYQAKDYFESWGVNITTVARSVSLEVPSCPFNEPMPTTADILLADFDVERIQDYDFIYIPSGPHRITMSVSTTIRDFLVLAHEAGLIIGTQCIGNTILANGIENMTSYTKVANYRFTNNTMLTNGAIPVDSRVVIDNGIVTGGAGGGYTGVGGIGVNSAPIYEVCSAMIRAVTGHSFVESITIEHSMIDQNSAYLINVETTDPYEFLLEVNSTEISTVAVCVYPEGNFSEPIAMEYLTDDEGDGTFTGQLSGIPLEGCEIVIEIEDDAFILEVVKDTYLVNTIPFQEILIGIGIAAASIIVIWFFYLKKNR